MKKILVLFLALVMAGSFAYAAKSEKSALKEQAKQEKELLKAEKNALKAQARTEKQLAREEKIYQKELKKELNNPKDVLGDAEYKQIKRQYFDAEGYGAIYNCKVEKQKFCRVKDFDTGFYTLCDRNVSRTQMESAKLFYQLGRCVRIN